MDKPFDVSALVATLKSTELPLVEQDVKILTKAVFQWANDSVALLAVSQPLYVLLQPALVQLQTLALAAEDKIDGQVNP